MSKITTWPEAAISLALGSLCAAGFAIFLGVFAGLVRFGYKLVAP